jgi:hypothetical protein
MLRCSVETAWLDGWLLGCWVLGWLVILNCQLELHVLLCRIDTRVVSGEGEGGISESRTSHNLVRFAPFSRSPQCSRSPGVPWPPVCLSVSTHTPTCTLEGNRSEQHTELSKASAVGSQPRATPHNAIKIKRNTRAANHSHLPPIRRGTNK